MLVTGGQSIQLNAPLDWQSSVTAGQTGDTMDITFASGTLAGLTQLSSETIPNILSQLDEFAVEMMRITNKLHAEGLGKDGRFDAIIAEAAVHDMDGDGNAANDVLAEAGLPFTPSAGDLTIKRFR